MCVLKFFSGEKKEGAKNLTQKSPGFFFLMWLWLEHNLLGEQGRKK